jgi:TonB family protein
LERCGHKRRQRLRLSTHQRPNRPLLSRSSLTIVVSETGGVESAEVVSGNPVLAKAAISAVEKWKFQPYIRSGI